MTGLVPYLLLPGTARAALTRYAEIFGGELALHSYADFGRDDGPADAIAHGVLSGPAVQRIVESPLREVVVTNSIAPTPEVLASGKIRVISIAKLLAEAIRRIHNSDSVSSLFV